MCVQFTYLHWIHCLRKVILHHTTHGNGYNKCIIEKNAMTNWAFWAEHPRKVWTWLEASAQHKRCSKNYIARGKNYITYGNVVCGPHQKPFNLKSNWCRINDDKLLSRPLVRAKQKSEYKPKIWPCTWGPCDFYSHWQSKNETVKKKVAQTHPTLSQSEPRYKKARIIFILSNIGTTCWQEQYCCS
jgi:hypothetical protein